MSNYMDLFQLAGLPLSAYTPGQGDLTMEGGFQTATGAPMYTLESYLAGKAPYVTGATSMRKPSGDLVYRTIGEQMVPVRVTDYGPGVKGLDIATENRKWATNFPYQGQRDVTGAGDSLNRYKMMLAQSQSASPTLGPMSSGKMSTWADYTAARNTPTMGENLAGSFASALGSIGKGMQQSGQASSQQAMAMLKTSPNPLAQLLSQYLSFNQQEPPIIQI